MPAFFKNRIVQFFTGFLVVSVGFFIVLAIIVASMNSARSHSTGLSSESIAYQATPEFGGVSADFVASAPANRVSPVTPGGIYSGELERYETTDYRVNGRSKDFADICNALRTLKTDARFHFKSLTESLNNCGAVFFVDTEYADSIVSQLLEFQGVTITRNTQSVTRHREYIELQTTTIEQQLVRVNQSISAAEIQFNEIADFARSSNDASTLSEAINNKFSTLDRLYQRQQSLTQQLDSLYQQAADLSERINVAQFSVSVSRSYPINPDENSRKWEAAWKQLSERFTDTLIGVTATFGVILLWALQITLYLLIGIIILRGLWKFIRLVWRR